MLPGKKESKSTPESIGAAARNSTATAAATATAPPPPVQEGREKAAFSFPVVKRFTGKVQYAINRADEAQLSHGKVLRGEVFAVRAQRYADGLVENGDVAHVAADTPLGQPAEFTTAGRKQVVPGEPTPPTDTTNAGATTTAAPVTGTASAAATDSGSTGDTK